jgi:probable F420-dependent oxidoreductase
VVAPVKKPRLSISMVAGTHEPIAASTIAQCASAVENAGFHKLYLTDHFFSSTPTFHSTSAFAVAAAATQHIPLGFCSYIAPLRHAIVAAKELAFLDGLCGGRLSPGLAAGSSRLEFEAFGIPFESRGKRLDESIVAIKRLWTEDHVSFDGEHFRFEDVTLTPKPIAQPHPSIWIGSWTGPRAAAKRIVEHADGWQASGLHATLDQGAEGWRRIEAMCDEMDRDPGTIGRALVNLIVRIGKTRDDALQDVHPNHRMHDDLIIAGTVSEVTDRLAAIYDTCFDEVAVFMPADALDQIQMLAEDVMPNLG